MTSIGKGWNWNKTAEQLGIPASGEPLPNVMVEAEPGWTDPLMELKNADGDIVFIVNSHNTVVTSLDVICTNPAKGVILTDESFNQWRLKVSTEGDVTAVAVT